MNAETRYTKGLLGELERLAKPGKPGCISAAVSDFGNLTREEQEAFHLLGKILSNQQAAMEYELMKYRLASEALGIAHWDMDVVDHDIINPDNRFMWSQEFRVMLGFSDESDFPNLQSSWSDRLHPEDKERTLSAFAAHLNDRTGKTPYDLEYRLMLKTGEYRYFRAFGATVRTKDGTPLRVAGALQDVTAKKQVEEAEAAAKLQAQAANRAKTTFLATMSHEIRTPLNAIVGMTAIGKKAADTERKDYAFSKIEDASNHLLGVINDILDVTKIEANKLELSSEELDFERMIQKAVSIANFRVEEKQQRLFVNVDSNVPRFIVSDGQRLTQILTNLLSNAVKFSPEGGCVRLNVSLEGETGEYCELRFEVADNGIGIAPKQLEEMFEAFTQADSGISREYGGLGLGLNISKRIVGLMDGKIWVKSEVGKGSRFFFTIKARRGETQFPDERKESEEGEQADDWCKGEFIGKSLLLVEDIETNREIILALLEDTGLLIDCAANGAEALAMVKDNPGKYDLVFMDMQMPVMDGLEATRRIRALPDSRCRQLPIVAMTANVFSEDIEYCRDAGMDGHIGKPLDMDELAGLMRKYLADG